MVANKNSYYYKMLNNLATVTQLITEPGCEVCLPRTEWNLFSIVTLGFFVCGLGGRHFSFTFPA
jgi:hypothetical protein